MGRAIFSEFASGGNVGPCILINPAFTLRSGRSEKSGEGYRFVCFRADLAWDERDASEWSWAIGGTDKHGNLFVAPSEDGETPALDPGDESAWPLCNTLVPVDATRDWQPYENSEFGMFLQSLSEAGFDLTEIDENGAAALDGLSIILIQHEYEVNGKKRSCPIVDSIRDGGEPASKQSGRKASGKASGKSAGKAGRKTPAGQGSKAAGQSASKKVNGSAADTGSGDSGDADNTAFLREKAEELALELLAENDDGLSAHALGTKAFASRLARDQAYSVSDKKTIRDLIIKEAAGFDGVSESNGVLTLG